MQRKTVFLLHDTKEFNDELTKKFDEQGEFEVVGTATDGVTAISLISERKPDFLITGLVLPAYDGLSVITKLRTLSLGVKIIVLSALSSEEVIASATQAGANYFMAKPYNFGLLVERMKFYEKENNEQMTTSASVSTLHKVSLEEKISKIFINVGIPPHIKGYGFLREGVKMAVNNPDVINNITKQLYPQIGVKYNTTASKVERAIRHAIEVAWNRGRIDNINSILGVRAYIGAEKPTNGEFIALVADKMILEKQ
ncbi:MAG: sporulation transcription factor Spo0A [Clostridia bacterium]|nr:sporulation transcription factor Spo0A [Clostridia bacterium]